MFSWSSSTALQRIFEGLEEQRRIIEQLKVYLEERVSPFHRHIGEHRRNIDQALRHLEVRLKPLRQYIEGEHQNLNWITAYFEADLREQFEAFEELLTRQKGLLEETNQYIEEQPRPFQTYLEDERRVVDMIHRDLEERLDRFFRNLTEQQKILESLRDPEVISEYEALAEYLEERQKILERHIGLPDHRPAELFAQLEAAADRYKSLHQDRTRLFGKVFEETRLADEKLRQALVAAKNT